MLHHTLKGCEKPRLENPGVEGDWGFIVGRGIWYYVVHKDFHQQESVYVNCETNDQSFDWYDNGLQLNATVA